MSEKIVNNLKRKRSDTILDGSRASGAFEDVAREKRTRRYSYSDDSDVNDELTQQSDQSTSRRHEFLLEAYQKIEELEHELALLEDEDYDSGHHEDDDSSSDELSLGHRDERLLEEDAKALGFAVCVREALTFLSNEGCSADHPVVQAIRDKLVGQCNGLPLD